MSDSIDGVGGIDVSALKLGPHDLICLRVQNSALSSEQRSQLVASLQRLKEERGIENPFIITDKSAVVTGLSSREEVIRWVPVNDRLPSNDRSVLVQIHDGEVFMGHYDQERGAWFSDCSARVDIVHCDLVHWAELPVGPKDKE